MYEFDPITKRVPVRSVTNGAIVMAGPHDPAVVVAKIGTRPAQIYCRFTWQEPSARRWLLGSYYPDDQIEVPVMDTRQFTDKEKS